MGTSQLDGRPLTLTAFEWRLLSALILRKGTVVPRSELAEQVYEFNAEADFKSLEVIIGRIRRKIGAEMIQTVRNRGYALTDAAP